MIYVNFGGSRDSLKQNLAMQFCKNRNKDVSVLTETHINLDQIHNIRNNWLGAIFFPPGDSQKDCLSCFMWVLKVLLRLTMIQKGILCPLRLLPLMAEFPVFMSFHGIAPRNSWIGGVSLNAFKIIWEIKNEGNENKIILGGFNFTMDETEKDGRNKTLYRCRFNYALSKLIVDNRLEDLWTRENPDSSEFTIDLLAQDLG